MEKFKSIKSGGKELVKVRAYQGDAATFLAFDLDKSLLKGFVGFSIQVEFGSGKKKIKRYLLNRLTFSKAIRTASGVPEDQKESSEFSPYQKFNWVHVPSTDRKTNLPFFGKYTYFITPRFLKNGKLAPPDRSLTVEMPVDVNPFIKKGTRVGFARAFISSQAYVRHFGMKSAVRPNKSDLIFPITEEVTVANAKPYTYEEQHTYLGWQARARVMEFLEEADKKKLDLEVFAFDLNEPVIAQKLIDLAAKGRVRIVLDDSKTHNTKSSLETKFAALFKKKAKNPGDLVRGHFSSLAHSKVFIQKKGNVALKVLTGSTNFSTNGLYINANHVVIFDNKKVADLYSQAFAASFGKKEMSAFKKHDLALGDHLIKQANMPDMTIRFSPHNKEVATKFFKIISDRIDAAKSDVLFAIMQDGSASGILDAVKRKVKQDKVFTYGITDKAGAKYKVTLYKPNSKKGVRVAGKGTAIALPPPFSKVPPTPGISIHHKFVVVDFKGEDPVVYCGSSNLAFGPEQANGDNLLEIRDRDIVTAFAIEAIRLVDHFEWRNAKLSAKKEFLLDDLSDKSDLWYQKYYNKDDLRCVEREKYIAEPAKPAKKKK